VIVAIYRNGGDDDDIADWSDRLDLNVSNFTVTENAEELTVGSSNIVADDPDGDWDLAGHAYVRFTETEADDTIIWAGFATIREISRGDYAPQSAQRQWSISLDDVNTVIARRILTDDIWDRPAETDVERVQALFDANYLGPDDSFFSTSDPVDMSPSDCRKMTVYDVVNDCLLQSGKNSYQQDIEDGTPRDPYGPDGYVGMTWYDFATSTARSSDLRISNYDADIDAWVGDLSGPGPAWTWGASIDTKMKRDPTRIYWKIVGDYDGGFVVRTRPATAAIFAARETTASWPLVKTQAQAIARADRMLDDIATEEDIITTTIEVHPEHVNDARAGHRIECRFSHLPGYEDWTWMRILNRTVKLITPRVYSITYTLSPPGPAIPAVACATAGAAMSVLDSGLGTPSLGPFAQTPATPGATPSLILGVYMVSEGTGFLFEPTDTTLDAPWTQLDHYWAHNAVHSFAGIGYLPWTTGAPAVFQVSSIDGSGGHPNWELMTFDLQTVATSPVQHATQISTGGTVTFGATPTPGNIIISYAFVEDAGAVASGFTQVANVFRTGSNLGLNGISMIVSYRCVQPGDTGVYGIGYIGSFTHHTFMSEWAL